MSSQKHSHHQILDAAEQLLADNPDFTMDELGTAVSLSRATLYRKVGSKEALLQRLADERGLDSVETTNIRTRVLLAAQEIFGRYGLLEVTMEQIAQEAGVGVATLYRHFGDKDGLVRAFASELTPHRAIADAAQHVSGNLTADLTQVVTHMLQFLYNNRGLARLSFMQSEKTQQYLTHIRPAPERTLHQLVNFFEAQRSAGHLPAGNLQHLALALTGMIFGFGFMAPTYYDMTLEEPEVIAEFIVNLFLNGIRD
ncbi:MAG: helix-turn-helix transcriptional regulator [Ardenticatenaceae bacterium]|nr:helix-turn-helix transcriptional regulator [Ardenticatenaceae bacterium]